jgi:hypothetical protein
MERIVSRLKSIFSTISRHRLVAIVFLAALLSAAFFGAGALERASAAGTSYSPLLPDQESVLVQAYETVQGILLLRDVAHRVTNGVEGDTARLTALVEWTHENVRPQYASPVRVVGDNVYSIVRRGFGYCDQDAHVFATLATLAGSEARLLFLYDERGSSPHTVAQVRIGDRWIVADPWWGIVPVDRSGSPMTVEDMAAHPDLMSAQLDYPSAAHIGIDEFQRGRPFQTFPYAPSRYVLQRVLAKLRSVPVVRPASASASAAAPAGRRASSTRPAGVESHAAAVRQAERRASGWPDALTYDRARRAHLRGNYADAVVLYRRISLDNLDPELADGIRFFTGLALFRMGRLSDAVDEFSRAMTISPSGVWRGSLLRYRGEARISLGDPNGFDDLESADTPGSRRLLQDLR